MIIQHAPVSLFGLGEGDVLVTETELVPAPSKVSMAWKWAAATSAIASAYHGSKRHHGSVWQTVKWGILGSIFPIITPLVAVGQGFAKPESEGLRGARRRKAKTRRGR